MDTIVLNDNKYQVLEKFTKSVQSECYLIERDNVLQVLKLYLNDEHVKPNIRVTEIRKSNKHDNILNVFESGFYNNRYYEITEFCQGKTLLEAMPLVSIDDFKSIIFQINEALNYCHSNGFMYFDIKPANIFFRKQSIDSLVLGDFGNSKFFINNDKFLVSNLTKPWYSPPEAHSKFYELCVLDSSFDYYTLGVMLIELITGDNQLKYFDNSTLLELKINEKIDLSKIEDSRLKTLISNLLKSDSCQRWLYNEVNNWVLDMSYDPEISRQKSDSHFYYLKTEAIRKKELEIIDIEEKYNKQYSISKDINQKQLILEEKYSKISKLRILINEINSQ